MTPPDRREWTAGIRSGDHAAFERLFELYAGRVAGFTQRLIANRSDRDDVVQDVFLAAYTGRESFRGKAGPLAWLLGIAVRRCRDHARKRPLELADVETLDCAGSAAGHCRPVEDCAVRSVTLAEALDTIEPAFRIALLLVASQGLTYAEAAAVTGEPIGTVKWRVSVASARMRHALHDGEEQVVELPKTQV